MIMMNKAIRIKFLFRVVNLSVLVQCNFEKIKSSEDNFID